MSDYIETLENENIRPQKEEETNEDIFIRRTVDENIYNSRGCSKVPSMEDTPKCRGEQMGCCAQMHSYNWTDSLGSLPSPDNFDLVEVRFKNTHKEFFKLPDENKEDYQCGDIVAVEGNPGHNIGIICLRGELARIQAINKGIDINSPNIKKLYRRARQNDVDKWVETIRTEKETQRRARIIAADLGLDMKINNVEYQGDFTKAVFYYTAEDRVDFRQLIKLYAEEFKVRIEMKQIGARQEAGNIGGIGSCGRELCCVTFLHNFTSVSTNSARVQQVSLNPQKLAGQCSKLKCCLNFEYDTYIDIQRSMTDSRIPIETSIGKANCIKTDILRKTLTYVYEDQPGHYYEIDSDTAQRMIDANKRGEKHDDFPSRKAEASTSLPPVEFSNVVGQDDLTRFDNTSTHNSNQDNKTNKKKKKKAINRTDKQSEPKPEKVQSNNKKTIGKPILLPKDNKDENSK